MRFTLARWGGGGVPHKWSLGWWTGPDSDMHCVRPGLWSQEAAETHLSPVCESVVVAMVAFVLKWMLAAIDDNMVWARGREVR